MALFLATREGVVVCSKNGDDWEVVQRTLTGYRVTTVIAREGVVLAGAREGIFRSEDGGHSWREASNGLRLPYVRWLSYHPEVSDLEVAGTEPASIFVSRDGGENWQECAEVVNMQEHFGWYLPYSPEAGCVRGLAFHGARAYAAVEVGGVLRSDNQGASWQLVKGSTGDPSERGGEGKVHADVHSIMVHPSSPDLVVAPTGGGLFRSRDGGLTWESLYRCYCRAAWLDPEDPDHLIFGPAENVDRRGRMEESHDGGRTWHAADDGLNTPWSRHMVERLSQIDKTLFAVLSNGQLLCASLEDLRWRTVLPEAGSVNDLAFMGQIG